MKNSKINILITGASGYLGTSLINELIKRKDINQIIGTDVQTPKISNEKFIFYKVDTRDSKKHRGLLEKYKVSQVFHFAFVLGEPKDEKQAYSINVKGTEAIIEASNQVKTVKRIIFAGSISAYGAIKTNKLFLKEDSPLKANTLKYGINKRLMENTIEKQKSSLREDLKLLILRICTIVGPTDRDGGAVQAFLSAPFGLSILRRPCPIQFVHEEDLFNAFNKVMDKPNLSGIYNLAPDDYTSIKEICTKLKKTHIYLPYSIAYMLFFIIFRVKPSLGISENSVSYLSYPTVVDNKKIKKEINIKFKYQSLEAFVSCANALLRKKV